MTSLTLLPLILMSLFCYGLAEPIEEKPPSESARERYLRLFRQRYVSKKPAVRNNGNRNVPEEKPPSKTTTVRIIEIPIERPPVERKYERKEKIPIELPPVKRTYERKYIVRNNRPSNKVTEKSDKIQGSSQRKTCLRKGCNSLNGLRLRSVDSQMKRALLRAQHYGGNHKVFKVATWNVGEGNADRRIKYNSRNEICNYIKTMDPTVFGLQEVSNDQLQAISRCLPSLKYLNFKGNSYFSSDRSETLYNPIFYNRKKIQVLKKGTFYGNSDRGNKPIATWLKVDFSMKKKQNIKALFSRLRLIMRNIHSHRRNPVKAAAGGAKSSNVDLFIVNTNLESKYAKPQVEELLKALGSENRYWELPTVLLGDMKFEDNSEMYKALLSNGRFKNMMDKQVNKFAHPAVTRLDSGHREKDVVDYVWQYKLHPSFAATISDRPTTGAYKNYHRPIFAAFAMN